MIHFVYQIELSRFTLRLIDPVFAAKELSSSLDNSARVFVDRNGKGKVLLSGLEIQEEMYHITETILHDHGASRWTLHSRALWRKGIDAVRGDAMTLCSDFQVKKLILIIALVNLGSTWEIHEFSPLTHLSVKCFIKKLILMRFFPVSSLATLTYPYCSLLWN